MSDGRTGLHAGGIDGRFLRVQCLFLHQFVQHGIHNLQYAGAVGDLLERRVKWQGLQAHDPSEHQRLPEPQSIRVKWSSDRLAESSRSASVPG